MKNKIIYFCAILTTSVVLTSCGNSKNDTTESSQSEKTEKINLSEIKLNNLKTGDILIFGEGCNKACDSVYLEFLESNKAKVYFTHVYEMNGNSGIYKKEQEEGEYSVTFLAANEIITDNNYWPLFDSVIVLSNDQYGFDHGHLHLSKKFAIAKSKNKSSNEIQGPIIYEWLDPINYPSRNGEYSSSGSIIINKVVVK
jgi:hypothetical protein